MAVNQQIVRALRVRRMMNEIGVRRRRRLRRIPAAREPSAARLQYAKWINGIQRALEKAVRSVIYPNLNQLAVEARIERPDSIVIRIDQVPTEFIERMIRDVRVTLGVEIQPRSIDAAAGQIGAGVADFNRRDITRTIGGVLGIDPVTAEPWMENVLTVFRKENVNLITSLVDDELSQIENILLRGQARGLRVEVLKEQIQKRFNVSENKAALLARDQTNKLNGQITALRNQALGIQEYIWRTSLDDRVRETHIELEGTRHRWDNPPVTNRAGDRNHPGEDYQCRCYAEPVIEPLIEALQGES